jgi:rhamnosyltransferase
MSFSHKTVAVTVTYNPDFTILREQLTSLHEQCRTVIIDNHSTEETFKPISDYCRVNDLVEIIRLANNLGISNAQNIGIDHVMKNFSEARFVLLLDHDSIPGAEMIRGLEDEFQLVKKTESRIAAIGPLLFDPRDKKHLGFYVIKNRLWKKIIPSKNSKPIECHSLNSSGSLISLDTLLKIGLLEKDFFMDHGETEWCFRAIDKGYKIYGSARVTMDHLMGDAVCEYWLFGRRRMPYRSPLRHYYIARNSILLQKRSYIPITWKFWNVVKLIFTYGYFGFCCQESKEHRHYIWKGIHDGLKGITGE